jgi:hypothetical protein
MIPRLVTALSALALVGSRPAAAEPHKVLVLQSEGRVPAAVRARIDAALLTLIRTTEPDAAPGELSFSDAATAVGCKPDTAACKDDVLGMLAVDEIVITQLAPRPGGTAVTVQRVAKGRTREATALLTTGGSPDKLDAIASLFAAGSEASPAGPPLAPGGAGAKPPVPAVPGAADAASGQNGQGAGVPAAQPAATEPADPADPAAAGTAPRLSPLAPPADQPDARRHRLELAGMIGGGSMVAVGLVLWGAAAGVQGEINGAPTATRQDLSNLRNLESKGDTYAALGNVFSLVGLVAGGIGTYFYIADRRAGSATGVARITPRWFDHGAGLVLTIGAAP